MNTNPVPATTIIFGNDNDLHVERLTEKLKQYGPSLRLIRCNSVGAVESMIDNFDKMSTVLILMLYPDGIGDAFLIMKQKGALNGLRIILILPEIDDYRLQDYLKLAPSYIAYQDSDFNDVTAVMAKMNPSLANLEE